MDKLNYQPCVCGTYTDAMCPHPRRCGLTQPTSQPQATPEDLPDLNTYIASLPTEEESAFVAVLAALPEHSGHKITIRALAGVFRDDLTSDHPLDNVLTVQRQESDIYLVQLSLPHGPNLEYSTASPLEAVKRFFQYRDEILFRNTKKKTL